MPLIVTTSQADTYFTTRRNSGEWDESGLDKITELTTAQNQLELFYTLSDSSERHQNAVCEQAIFNIKFGDGMEKRDAMKAAGVVEVGLVKERFREGGAGPAICPYALVALQDVKNTSTRFFAGLYTIGRTDE